MDPFYKCISKRLLSGKAPSHEVDALMHIKGFIYKHVMDSNQWFLALVIPNPGIYPVQMTDIPDRLFDKIAKDLVSDLHTLHQEINTYWISLIT